MERLESEPRLLFSPCHCCLFFCLSLFQSFLSVGCFLWISLSVCPRSFCLSSCSSPLSLFSLPPCRPQSRFSPPHCSLVLSLVLVFVHSLPLLSLSRCALFMSLSLFSIRCVVSLCACPPPTVPRFFLSLCISVPCPAVLLCHSLALSLHFPSLIVCCPPPLHNFYLLFRVPLSLCALIYMTNNSSDTPLCTNA